MKHEIATISNEPLRIKVFWLVSGCLSLFMLIQLVGMLLGYFPRPPFILPHEYMAILPAGAIAFFGLVVTPYVLGYDAARRCMAWCRACRRRDSEELLPVTVECRLSE